MSTDRLFVYGSLKRDGRHHDLMARARFIAEASTAPGFRLEQLEGSDYMALLPEPGALASVAGELFEVSPALLAEIDEFEGHEYERRTIPVREMSGEIRFALAYLKKPR